MRISKHQGSPSLSDIEREIAGGYQSAKRPPCVPSKETHTAEQGDTTLSSNVLSSPSYKLRHHEGLPPSTRRRHSRPRPARETQEERSGALSLKVQLGGLSFPGLRPRTPSPPSRFRPERMGVGETANIDEQA